MFNNIYNRKKVLITGHTGFKGSWLAMWLSSMGAEVIGYALEPPTEPNHFQLLNMEMVSEIGDIRDTEKLGTIFKEYRPEIVFHLAGQAIVRLSYKNPVDTFTSNVMGTINVFEASRQSESVRAIVNITSDKCYENREWPWGYRETDLLGGYDPYSASKSCAELITNCWRNSFFNIKNYGVAHNALVASSRVGNVIGGGDWGIDRLIPDIMREVSQQRKVRIRNPQATRPWQHVLEPLSGYLLLGQKLLEGRKELAEAWNFGPSGDESITVRDIVHQMKRVWPEIDYEVNQKPNQSHEACLLKLDSSKARTKMKWAPVWDSENAVMRTAQWYKAFYDSNEILSFSHLERYAAEAQRKRMVWANE